VERDLLVQPPERVAPLLLHKVLVCGGRSGRIVEVEAYGGADDPASHAHRGPTPRSAIMFEAPGHLYVYRSYGVHWCANVVAHPPGVAGAVLIRALEPLAGTEDMWLDRPAARRPIDLASGPGRLCAALGIGGAHDGTDLLRPESPVLLIDDGMPPPVDPAVGPRVGISAAREHPWRFWVADHPHRSRR
jgi:DNA-3-methyladenine glycosylase